MNIRYHIEHEVFLHAYQKDPVKVITKALTKKEQYIYEVYLAVYERLHEVCPYEEWMFEMDVFQIDQMEFIVFSLPNREMKQASCHNIILAYSYNLDLYQYYTLEHGSDPLFGEYKILCTWIEGTHMSISEIKEGEDVLQKIFQFAFV